MAPRWDTYRGGFEHPLRAFALGIGLIALLVAGFVLGTGLGSGDQVAATVEHVRIVTRPGRPQVRVVTHVQPVVRTVVRGHKRLVRLPGSVVYRLERLPAGEGSVRTVFRVQTVKVPQPVPPPTSTATAAATTLFAPDPTTVTVTESAVETVTETVTRTVTAPGTTEPTNTQP